MYSKGLFIYLLLSLHILLYFNKLYKNYNVTEIIYEVYYQIFIVIG